MLLRIALASVALVGAALMSSPSDAGTYYVDGSAPTANATCLASAPCSTISKALANAGPGDAIICLSAPDRDTLNIKNSVTIDCSAARGAVRDFTTTVSGLKVGIVINIPAASTDPLRTVRLRGLTIDGTASPTFSPSGRVYDVGIDILAASAVYIEDCVIANVNQVGIYDHRSGGQTRLIVTDSIISGAAGGGIIAAAGGTTMVVLDNVRSENNGYGIAVATGNNAIINRSVFSGNSTAGVEGDSGSQITLENSVISHNNFGVQSSSSVRLANNNISFNNTAIAGTSASLGNNRFSGNISLGTPPTRLTGAPADISN
jgi:Right handed beta helix region